MHYRWLVMPCFYLLPFALTSCSSAPENTGPKAKLQYATTTPEVDDASAAQSQWVGITEQIRGTRKNRKRIKTASAPKEMDFDEEVPGKISDFPYRLEEITTKGYTAKKLYDRIAAYNRTFAQQHRLAFHLNPNRTQVMTYALHQETGLNLGILQIYFSAGPNVAVKNQSAWWFHLGTVALENGKKWVVDLSQRAPARAIPIEQWVSMWTGKTNCAEVTHQDSQYFPYMRNGSHFPGLENGGSADCYYRILPMYYWTPKSIVEWDLGRVTARTRFNAKEVQRSCVDGTKFLGDLPQSTQKKAQACQAFFSGLTPTAEAPVSEPAPQAPAPVAPIAKPSPAAPKPVARPSPSRPTAPPQPADDFESEDENAPAETSEGDEDIEL